MSRELIKPTSLSRDLQEITEKKTWKLKEHMVALESLTERLIKMVNEDPLYKNHMPTLMRTVQILMQMNNEDFRDIWGVALALKSGKLPHYGEGHTSAELELAQKLVDALTPDGRQKLSDFIGSKP